MSVKKRTGSPFYWCNFSIGGERIRESTGTTDREAAERYEAKRKAEIWERQRLGAKPRRPWPEAVVRWLREKSAKKSIADDISTFKWLDPHLRELAIQDIDEDVIADLITKRLADGVANATANRMLAVLRAVLRRAEREWRWMDRSPVFPRLPEPKRRVRWLKPEDAKRLLDQLPPHLSALSEFSLETGLRASNVALLRWDQVDMQRHCAWVYADESKSGHAIGIPLSERAIGIIKEQLGKHLEFVFTYKRGKNGAPHPIRWGLSTKAWYKALKRAGITDFRWHDQRHTWASWHVQDGTPAAVLQELGNWSDIRMLRKYAHLNTEHLRAYVDRGTKLTQS